MSISIKRHVFVKEKALEEVVLEDSHGREHHIQIPVLSGVDPDAFIKNEMDAFAETEAKLTEHINSRFDPETLERLKSE